MVELAQAKGIWVEADNYIPAPGDFLLYDWDDNTGSNGDNQGYPDHIGVCESVVGDTITVIEGNYKNAVGRRTIKVNGKNIRGYIVPKYAAEKADTSCSLELRVLKKGAKGEDVKAMQTLLIGYGFSFGSYGADGIFGAGTGKALKAFQKANGLVVDGYCVLETWAKLLGTS